MKRLSFTFIFSLFLILGLTVKATTTTTANNNFNSDDELIEAGTIPGDFFYAFDRFFENVSLKLTLSDEKRIEKYIQYAEERLAELNEIDPEKRYQYIDKLYDDYGVNLQNANQILMELITNGNTKKDNLEKLQMNIEKVTSKEEVIDGNIKENINQEIKEKMQEVKINSYLITMINEISMEDLQAFTGKKINKRDIIEIKSLSLLSGLSISEILELDIFEEQDPVSNTENLKINYNKLQEQIGIDKKQLVEDLKEYHQSLKENRQAEREKQKAEKEKGKTQEEIEKIKEEAQKKQEEAQKKRDEIKEKIKEKIEERQNNNGNDGNSGENGNNGNSGENGNNENQGNGKNK